MKFEALFSSSNGGGRQAAPKPKPAATPAYESQPGDFSEDDSHNPADEPRYSERPCIERPCIVERETRGNPAPTAIQREAAQIIPMRPRFNRKKPNRPVPPSERAINSIIVCNQCGKVFEIAWEKTPTVDQLLDAKRKTLASHLCEKGAHA